MTSLASKQKTSPHTRQISINWPLMLGSIFVLLVIGLAIVGPNIAPNDPMEEHLLVQDSADGKWHIPPFTAFEVTGYPLGSDEFGRDLYSRLLWAIGPTLRMVAIVAATRLILGTLIGLVAGWNSGKTGKFFDTLISGALALPGLLVALGAIAVVGVEWGIVAFVIGLSVTGWAETARIVRDQTKTIKQQVYIEAAHAMGASDPDIVFRHVLRQIASMIWMLLAFEVGATLMLTAALGFLGYYIGGDVWVDVDDFVARRTSGAPELGQMLATAWVRLTDPWGLVSVGSVVFISVLGFNLIGEGLRIRIDPEMASGRIKWVSDATANLRMKLAQAWYPVGRVLYGTQLMVTFWWLLFLGAAGYGGYRLISLIEIPEEGITFLLEGTGSLPTATPSGTATTVDGSESGGTDSQNISGEPIETAPPAEPVVVWTYKGEGQITGQPILSEDGILYINSTDNKVSAINPDGSVLWQATLAARPVGSPAFGPDGTIYATDKAGGVNAISPAGDLLWYYLPDPARAATSGPFVASDGTILYAAGSATGILYAVAPDGSARWTGQGETFSYYRTPSANPDSGLAFLSDDLFSLENGTLLAPEFPAPVDYYLLGQDGKTYARISHNVLEWQFGADGTVEIVRSFLRQTEAGPPTISGILATGVSWEMYTFELGGASTVLYVNGVDGIGQVIGGGSVPITQAQLVYADPESYLTVLCGWGNYQYPNVSNPKPECHAFLAEEETEDEEEGTVSLWQIQLKDKNNFIGAAFDGDKMLYIAVESGKVFAVDTSPEAADSGNAGDPNTAIATGSGWRFNLPESMLIPPLVHENGSTYILGLSNTFYVIDPDGTQQAVIPLPVPVYEAPQSGFGGRGSIPFTPALTASGSMIVAGSESVYEIGLDGTVLWEVALDERPFAPPSSSPDKSTFFLLDRLGSLYALTPGEGLLWKHDLAEGLKAASPTAVFGSNGEIFYTITNGTKGMIEALGADGTPLWRTDLATFNFFRPIQITPAGDWLAVNDNVVNTITGERVAVSGLDIPVNQFAMGEDGKTYLVSGNTFIEWTLDPGGEFQIVSQLSVTFPEGVNNNNTPFLSIAADGTLWMQFNVGRGARTIHMWVAPDGTVLGVHEINNTRSAVVRFDLENVRLAACGPEDGAILCTGYERSNPGTAWQIRIDGISEAGQIIYRDGRLYIQIDGDTIQVVEVELP